MLINELSPGEFYVVISGRLKGRLGRAFSYFGEPCSKLVFLDNEQEISFSGANFGEQAISASVAGIENMSDFIDLPLDFAQRAQFTEFISRQKEQRELAIFAVLAPSYDPAAGCAVIRLRIKSVPWNVGKKVVNLLRAAS